MARNRLHVAMDSSTARTRPRVAPGVSSSARNRPRADPVAEAVSTSRHGYDLPDKGRLRPRARVCPPPLNFRLYDGEDRDPVDVFWYARRIGMTDAWKRNSSELAIIITRPSEPQESSLPDRKRDQRGCDDIQEAFAKTQAQPHRARCPRRLESRFPHPPRPESSPQAAAAGESRPGTTVAPDLPSSMPWEAAGLRGIPDI